MKCNGNRKPCGITPVPDSPLLYVVCASVSFFARYAFGAAAGYSFWYCDFAYFLHVMFPSNLSFRASSELRIVVGGYYD